MSDRQLEIRFGNVYVGNRTRRRGLRKLLARRPGHDKPDGIVIAEGGWAHRMTGMLRGYRVTRASAGERRGRTDVLVLVRRRLEYLGEIAIQVQPAMPKVGPSAHTRYVIGQCFNHPETGKTALLGWHPTPGPLVLRSDPDHPITKSYMAALTDLKDITQLLRQLGFRVVVCSDTQVDEDSEQPWAPIDNLAQVGLKTDAAHGIDLIAGDKRLDHVAGGVLEPAGPGTGADHPYLFAVYEWRHSLARTEADPPPRGPGRPALLVAGVAPSWFPAPQLCGATPHGEQPVVLDTAEAPYWRITCGEEAGHDPTNWNTPHRATGLGSHGRGEFTWTDPR